MDRNSSSSRASSLTARPHSAPPRVMSPVPPMTASLFYMPDPSASFYAAPASPYYSPVSPSVSTTPGTTTVAASSTSGDLLDMSPAPIPGLLDDDDEPVVVNLPAAPSLPSTAPTPSPPAQLAVPNPSPPLSTPPGSTSPPVPSPNSASPSFGRSTLPTGEQPRRGPRPLPRPPTSTTSPTRPTPYPTSSLPTASGSTTFPSGGSRESNSPISAYPSLPVRSPSPFPSLGATPAAPSLPLISASPAPTTTSVADPAALVERFASLSIKARRNAGTPSTVVDRSAAGTPAAVVARRSAGTPAMVVARSSAGTPSTVATDTTVMMAPARSMGLSADADDELSSGDEMDSEYEGRPLIRGAQLPGEADLPSRSRSGSTVGLAQSLAHLPPLPESPEISQGPSPRAQPAKEAPLVDLTTGPPPLVDNDTGTLNVVQAETPHTTVAQIPTRDRQLHPFEHEFEASTQTNSLALPVEQFQDALGTLHEAMGGIRGFLDQIGRFGSASDSLEQVLEAVSLHKCPTAEDARVVGLSLNGRKSSPNSRIARQARDIESLALRVQQAEAKRREAEAQGAQMAAELTRLTETLEQKRRDAETSEARGKILHSQLDTTVSKLAAAQLDVEDLRRRHSSPSQSPSFALVLLEGEGRMFDPKLLAMGADGGVEFMERLQLDVSRLFEMMKSIKCGKIYIYMFMDLAATFHDLSKAGCISSEKQLEDFFESMGQYNSLSIISDVPGQFGASSKIRAQMSSLGTLNDCGMILLGAANDRKYLDSLTQWTRGGIPVADKVFAARSRSNPQDEPFAPLGNDRLVTIPCLFPMAADQWDMLIRAPAAPNRGQLLMQATGASTARALPPVMQPDPALVPQYVVHSRTYPHQPDPYGGRVGSPIPFTPMPTGVRHPERVVGPEREPGGGPPSPAETVTAAAPRQTLRPSQPPTISAAPGFPPAQAAPPRGPIGSAPPPRTPAGPTLAPEPSTTATSAPPWQEYRARRPAPLPEMLARRVAAGLAAPPRRRNDNVIVFRKGARSPSIGGSPPTTDEDNPPDPTIPAAARMHVQRPPRFDTPTHGNGSATSGSHSGAPPSGFRVNERFGQRQAPLPSTFSQMRGW